jgi:hypothetical protein
LFLFHPLIGDFHVNSSCCRSFLLVLATALGLATAASAQTVPVADAGEDQTIDCALPAGAEVTLDGSGSSDPDDPATVLTYTWTSPSLADPLVGETPAVQLPPGSHTFSLVVADADGPSQNLAEVNITIIADTTPPELVLADEGDELWPPNHKLHGYEVADLVDSVSDDCSELTEDDVFFGRANSDESDDGLGDGSTHADVQFSDECRTADVRAERSGTGDGRVYELVLEVSDAAGNSAEPQVFTIAVPHDAAHDATDSGPAAEYVSECGEGLTSCAPAPATCTEAGVGDVALRATSKGPSVRWRSSGFPAGSVTAEGNAVCAYLDAALAGGSLAPDKVKVKNKQAEGSLSVRTRGDDLVLPPLPLAPGALLRLELHDGAGDCVSYEETAE